MSKLLSRREALRNLSLGAGALLAVGATARGAAAAPPHVAANDPMSVALSYVENAQSVDSKKFPNYKPGERCGNCVQSKGKGNDGDAWIGCNLFPGKVVSAQGWCRVYAART